MDLDTRNKAKISPQKFKLCFSIMILNIALVKEEPRFMLSFHMIHPYFFSFFRQYIQEGDAWELSTVNDVRPGTSPQEPRNHQLLVKKHGENVYEKSIVVCSGVDMVNIQYMNIIFKDAPTAEVRITKLFRI